MANQTGTATLKLSTAGEIMTTGGRILWIMHYAAADNGEILLQDTETGKEIFYYKNIDVSVLGNYQFFYLGGQSFPKLWLKTLTTSDIVWIGLM